AHSNEEQGHADLLAERIVQLGGEPDFSPNGLAARSHAEYVAGVTLIDMIREDLVAERIAIDSYRGFIQYLGDKDPTTRRMLESILAVEEQHANELADLLQDASGLPAKPRAEGLYPKRDAGGRAGGSFLVAKANHRRVDQALVVHDVLEQLEHPRLVELHADHHQVERLACQGAPRFGQGANRGAIVFAKN